MRKPFGAYALLAALLVLSGAVAGGTASGTAVPPREVRASQSGVVGPSSITAGPDGAVWFTESNNAIGRITTAGVVTNFTDPSIASPAGITAGPDGALWFTNFNNSSIGRITTSGVVTNFTDPSILFPLGIAAGPDGALWFINAGAVNAGGVKTNGSIGRITTTGTVTNYTDQSVSDPISITTGSDGALWFTNFLNNSIGRITTTGTITNYTHPSIVHPISIASSSCGGYLVYTQDNDSIGFLDPAGSQIFSITDPSVSAPDGITAPGPGCNVWFTNQLDNAIGHIQPSGAPGGWTFSHFTNPSVALPVGIAAGSDGAFWFTNFKNNSIGRITSSGALSMAARGGVRSAAAVATRSADSSSATPTARVGALYFDGWGGPLTNYHFAGLARPGNLGGPPNGQFPDRKPLYGWRDDSVETMRTQLAWARQAGIGFYLFEWFNPAYNNPDDPLNGALNNYMTLKDHNGVGFALSYNVGGGGNVTIDQLPAVANNWVTQYMLKPDYVRINGKPLLYVLERNDFANLYGDHNGVNNAIDVIQNAAKAHGLPGVYIVASHFDAQDYDAPGNTINGPMPDCFLNCWYDGELLQENWDALSTFPINDLVTPVDGPTPYARVPNYEETANWPRYAQQTTFPYIPAVGAGWDERAWDGQINDVNNKGHMFWFVRTPTDIGQYVTDAINEANQHPQMRAEPPPARPIVLIPTWSELAEGSYIVPTVQDGYGYLQAIATAVGLPWQTTHPRRFVSAKVAMNKLTGTLAVTDSWSPCVDSQTVVLQRKSSTAWAKVASATTQPGGSFSMKFPTTASSYRLLAAQSTTYQQTCAAATLKSVGTPGAPTAVTASARGGGTATVKWKAPTITNGAPIAGYVVTPIKAGVAQKPLTFKSTATTQTISGLIAGKSYTFKVAATNTRGTGTQSTASKPITAK
jgi:virginiamycin B lyase